MTRLRLPPLASSLSARLLWLTVLFVMLIEVLIYAPSAARFRQTWLEDRLAAARLAVTALEASGDDAVSVDLANRLLDHVGAHAIVVPGANGTRRGIFREMPPMADLRVDLAGAGPVTLIVDAFDTMLARRNRVLWVRGVDPTAPDVPIELVIDERPLHEAMVAYSWRILLLSLIISLFTAALVFLSLQWTLVRPLRQIAASMMRFKENPEDVADPPAPSRRNDEIGLVRRELAEMEHAVRQALHQRSRLAALGEAVTRINHDLRNILTTASLVSDRLADSDDPDVRRAAPTLIAAIDRAVQLCARTLDFARDGGPILQRGTVPLAALVDDVAQVVGAQVVDTTGGHPFVVVNAVPETLTVDGDRDLLFRVLANLAHNARGAGAGRLTVGATAADGEVRIEVADDGPGMPPKAVANLFRPFSGAGRAGGTGLGLAIARELMRAHRGDVQLVRTDAGGTVFVLTLPDSPARVVARAAE